MRKVKLETLAKWVHPAPLVHEGPLEPQEPTALRDLPVVSETRVLLEKRETPVRPECPVFRENSGPRVREASEERRESTVRLVQPDLRALRAPQETTVPKEARVRVVSPVTWAPPESPVQPD